MSIERLRFAVRAEQTLFLGAGPQIGNRRTSDRSLAGSALRGAIAGLWLSEFGAPDGRFHELFDSGLRWPTLHPRHTAVVPLSVRRCKYRPEPGCDTVAIDQFAPDTAEQPTTCPVCNKTLELAKGELMTLTIGHPPRTISRTTVTLGHDETADDGGLFTRDGLPAGTELEGATVLPRQLDSAIDAWLRSLEGRSIRVGGRKSVAGQATIVRSTIESDAVTDLGAGQTVAIRLVSPAIVLDASGATTLDPHALVAGTAFAGHVELVERSAFLRPTSIGGWNGLAGTPRPTDSGIVAGATVVVRVTAGQGIPAATVERTLRQGVGVRQDEGLGEVEIATHQWTPQIAAGSDPTAAPGEPTSNPRIEALIELVRNHAPRATGSRLTRDEVARWFAGRLRTTSQRLREDIGIDRDELAYEAAQDRRLRDVSQAVEDAYLAIVADSTIDHTALVLASRRLEQIHFEQDRTGKR